MKRKSGRVLCLIGLLIGSGASVLAKPSRLSGSTANQAEGKGDPSKDSKDVDTTVPYPMAKVVDAAKQAATTYGCDVKKEKADYFECTRDRHVGVMVGSGGEKVTVQLTEKGNETRVEIKTGKGFVGRLCKKNWSTPIFDEMIKTLKGS